LLKKPTEQIRQVLSLGKDPHPLPSPKLGRGEGVRAARLLSF